MQSFHKHPTEIRHSYVIIHRQNDTKPKERNYACMILLLYNNHLKEGRMMEYYNSFILEILDSIDILRLSCYEI